MREVRREIGEYMKTLERGKIDALDVTSVEIMEYRLCPGIYFITQTNQGASPIALDLTVSVGQASSHDHPPF